MKRLLFGIASAVGMACGHPMCVAKGTRVTTRHGWRRVEEIQVGDEVIAIDPSTGNSEVTRVTFVRSAMRECGRLRVGDTTLTVTSDHPLFDPDARQFSPAGEWLLGQRSRLCAFDGELTLPVVITSREVFSGVFEVYDLTVESQFHTFVAEGFVVHNKPAPYCRTPDGGHVSPTDPADMRPLCTCSDGREGRWTCQGGGPAICLECGLPKDGG